MKYNDRLKEIINEGKWVKNDIGMGRIQCSKIIKENKEPELTAFIVSDNLEKPVAANIEKVLVVNEELILFYDGQYATILEEDKYEEYRNFLTEEEWKTMFEKEATKKLKDKNMISKKEGYYLEIHETIENFMKRGYDKKATFELGEEFNLG